MPLTRTVCSGRQHGPLIEDPFEGPTQTQTSNVSCSQRSSRSSSTSSDPKMNGLDMSNNNKDRNNCSNNYRNKTGINKNRRPDSVVTCAVPSGCLESNEIAMGSLSEAVRVICNNNDCTQGNFMHKECFDEWEATVLTYLKSCGRARSWSEKQRLQNLWTKKGYDLTYKACGCKCGKGHLRKDLDWIPPTYTRTADADDDSKKEEKEPKEQDRQQQGKGWTTTIFVPYLLYDQ